MKYYVYRPDSNNYAGIGMSRQDACRVIDVHYQDSSLLSSWVPPVVHGFDDNPLTLGDFASLSNFFEIPVVSYKAWDALRPLLGICCEALPLTLHTSQAYFILHVMETVDALDISRSDVKLYSDGGIMRIIRYSFKSEALKGKHIFKLPQSCGGELIVDDNFRMVVENTRLAGLLFNELPLVE